MAHSPTGAWGGAAGAEPRSRGRVGAVGVRLRADNGNVTRCAACVLIRGKYEKWMASACRENAASVRAPARRHGPRGGEGGVCVCVCGGGGGGVGGGVGGGGGLRRSLPRRCTTAPLRARRARRAVAHPTAAAGGDGGLDRAVHGRGLAPPHSASRDIRCQGQEGAEAAASAGARRMCRRWALRGRRARTRGGGARARGRALRVAAPRGRER